MFHEWFFSTVQFIFAGNDSEGLQYGTVGTEQKYWRGVKQTPSSARSLGILTSIQI